MFIFCFESDFVSFFDQVVIGREGKKDAESPYVKLEKRERQNLEGQQQERPSADVNVTELKLLSPIPKKEYNLDQLPVAETFSKVREKNLKNNKLYKTQKGQVHWRSINFGIISLQDG